MEAALLFSYRVLQMVTWDTRRNHLVLVAGRVFSRGLHGPDIKCSGANVTEKYEQIKTDAPKLDVNTDEEIAIFIDQHQACVIPREEESYLRQVVFSLQKHVNSATCRRGGSCRFHFPHYPSSETVIARQPDVDDFMVAMLNDRADIFKNVSDVMEDKNVPEVTSFEDFLKKADVNPQEYPGVVKLVKSEKQVVLKRQPSER
ncbi:Hypothetical predicted protein [Octopus vulgaris]|uniref:Uncharacterized protein n=1 Tax=Octopus vulgaris TaxID=6645 RepID=A0AA36AJ20_OCTVU|nr:Hypothetical predicted protein [Octopus vulgaris]